MLDVIERVARLRDLDTLADDLVQIDELVPAQKVIDFNFASAVEHHKALQRRRLVCGIVINMRSGMSAEPNGDEVERRLERLLILVAIMRPERREPDVIIFQTIKAEQIFQAAARIENRQSLHAEENVAHIRERQAREAPVGDEGQE